jgi:ATP phosphoribosyltransferase
LAAGAAELIVDITTTGATLAANGLKSLEDGVILRSQANLVASLSAPWGRRQRELARVLLMRIAAAEQAREVRELRARLPGKVKGLAESALALFDARPAFDEASASGCVVLHAHKGRAADLAAWLLEQGASRVSVSALDLVFDAKNALYELLEARIGPEPR